MNNKYEISNFHSLPVVLGPDIANIKYFSTTRKGGYSIGAFDSLNLGFNTADNITNTEKNRFLLSKNLPSPVFWLDQVHDNRVVVVNNKSTISNELNRPSADAVVTNVAGQVLAIQTADCMPVIIAHEQGSCLGIAHAGWRGLVNGVIENTVQTLVNEYGIKTSNLVAWVGPCIHQDSFQVGSDVMHQFSSANSLYQQYFKPDLNHDKKGDKWLLDLPGIVNEKLSRLGLKKVYISNYCTYINDQLFYSYRRSNNTGRQATLAWISV